MNKIALFADVQNIYYTTRQAYAQQFDYSKLWQRVASKGVITTAIAYAIHRGNEKQLKFQSALKQIGFEIKLKPYITRSDGSSKGDWDVGIAIDVMSIAPKVDTVVLLSGDGDFDLLLSKIRTEHNTNSEVYGVPSLTAGSLIDAASVYHPIEKDLLLTRA